MPVFGERFVYGNKELSAGEVRVARTRAEFALWGRRQARRYAEARKRPKQTAGDKVDEALPPPVEEENVTVINNGPPVQDERPVVTEPCSTGQEDEVRRSLYLPAAFQRHLLRQEEFFLHYLRGHYGVSIYVDTPKKKVHIKGPKPNVVACLACVKELLVRWHQRQAGDQ